MCCKLLLSLRAGPRINQCLGPNSKWTPPLSPFHLSGKKITGLNQMKLSYLCSQRWGLFHEERSVCISIVSEILNPDQLHNRRCPSTPAKSMCPPPGGCYHSALAEALNYIISHMLSSCFPSSFSPITISNHHNSCYMFWRVLNKGKRSNWSQTAPIQLLLHHLLMGGSGQISLPHQALVFSLGKWGW